MGQPTTQEIWNAVREQMTSGEVHPDDICVIHTWRSLLQAVGISDDSELLRLQEVRVENMRQQKADALAHLERRLGGELHRNVNDFSRLLHQTMMKYSGAKIRRDNQQVAQMLQKHLTQLKHNNLAHPATSLNFVQGNWQRAQQLVSEGNQVGVFLAASTGPKDRILHAFHLTQDNGQWFDVSDPHKSSIQNFVHMLIREKLIDEAMLEPVRRARTWNLVTLCGQSTR